MSARHLDPPIARDLHIGLVGCGLWGRNILRDLRALGCTVHVAEPDAANRAAAEEGGAATVAASPDDLPTVDGLVVATPASTHVAVVEALLGRDVPIFLEKPFTPDLAAAERLAAQCPDRLFVMHVWRYHAGVEALAEIARTQALGPVLGLRTVRTNWTSPRRDIDSVWTLAPHDLSIALDVLGHVPEPQFATAEVHDGRAVGLLGVGGTDAWHVLEVSTRYGDKRRETRLHTTDGVAVLPTAGTHLDIYHGDARSETARVERRALPGTSALVRELEAFVAHLQGGPPPRSGMDDALAILRAMLRLRHLAGLDAS